MANQIDYTTDIVKFYADLFPVEGDYGPKPVVPPFLQEWLYKCFPLPGGDPIARNVLDSRSKKQGKSTTAALIALYLAARRRNAEIVIAAADKDQSRDRVLRAVKFAVENHPAWKLANVYKDVIELSNGSLITAISQDWRGAAGGNYSGVIFDELHVYTLESQRRLYDELIIPPSISAGTRWISTYAGYTGESKLLEEVWNLALAGERDPGELPIYRNQAASLMALIDTGPTSWRMPWTSPEYMAQVERSERPSVYRRLWLNEWVTSESAFLPEGAWDACRHPDVRPLAPGDNRRVTFGLDASTSRDLTALIGTCYDPELDVTDVVYVHVWTPKRGILRQGKPTVDLDLVKKELLRLHAAGQVASVCFDPFQLHSISLDLERAGIRMIEMPQSSGRVASDQALYDGVIARAIRHYGDPTLSEHVHNAIAIESPRGWRISKERTSRKIDACVALSMSYHQAISSKGEGEVTYVRDPFAEWPPPEDTVWNWERGWIVPNKYRRHSRGATGPENCTHRGRGCDQCEEELLPQIREQEAAAKSLGQTMSEQEFNDWEFKLRHPWQPPISDEERQADIAWRYIVQKVKRG